MFGKLMLVDSLEDDIVWLKIKVDSPRDINNVKAWHITVDNPRIVVMSEKVHNTVLGSTVSGLAVVVQDNAARKIAERVNNSIPVEHYFNGIYTTAIFRDGKKIVTNPTNPECYDREVGLAMAIVRKLFGGRRGWLNFVNHANDLDNSDDSE